MSLRVRLVLLVLGVFLVGFGLSLYSVREQGRLVTSQVQESVLALAKLTSTVQARQIAGTRQLLVGLAQLPEVRRQDAEACSRVFRELLAEYPLYASLGAIKPDGQVFCSALPMEEPVYAGDRAYFRGAVQTGRFAIGDYQIGRVSGRASVNFGYPAYDPDGRLRAVVVAALDLDWLNTVVSEARLPEGSSLIVLDSKGKILVHHPDPEKWVGKIAPDPLTERIVRVVEVDVAEAAGLDGMNRFFGFTPLFETEEGGNVYLSIGVPKEYATRGMRGLLIRNVTLFGFIGLLALVGVWVGADFWVGRRVKASVKSAGRIMGRESDPDLAGFRRSDEIAELERLIPEMAEKIRTQERELRETEEHFRMVVKGVGDYAIFLLSPEGNVVSWNEGAERIKGYREDEILGRHFSCFYTPEDIEAGIPALALRTAETEGVFKSEGWRIRKDGTRFRADVTLSAVRDPRGTLRGFLKVTRDIMERWLSEQDLRSSVDQFRALARRLQGIREEERALLAREIHDRMSGALTALKMELSLLEKDLGDLSEQAGRLRSMSDQIESILATVRKIATELRPSILDDLGLAAAVEWQAKEFERWSGIPCEFELPSSDPVLDRDRSTAVFRIIQEALVNVARHSGASRARIHLREEDGRVVLEVEDNGRGIREEEASRVSSLGILGMRERALAFGGELEVAGSVGGGTKVALTMPIAERASPG